MNEVTTHKFYMLLILLTCLSNYTTAQQPKVVGFLPHYRFQLVDEIDFSAVTHVNLAFANPDMEGNLSFEGAEISSIVELLHAQDKEVYISLAGGYLTPEWDLAWIELQKEENRSSFIHKIMEYCNAHEVDGIDMDLEWQYVGNNYSGFALELADSCLVHNISFTASLPGTYRYPEISDQALDAFQWINMMVYDLRGPWNPADSGPHAPYYFALNAIFYWNAQGVENDRLSMGLPFYGYDFTNESNVFARTYNNIIELNEANAYYDKYGEIYYNGIPSIKAKTQLAIDENLLGVMIWELGQDYFGELSLLQAIDDIINPVTSVEDSSVSFTIYPNPTRNNIFIESDNLDEIYVYNLLGIQVKVADGMTRMIDLSDLIPAVYVIKAKTNEGKYIQQLISKL